MNAIVVGAALAVGAPALKEKPKPEADIVGLWTVESMKMGGNGPPKIPAGLRYEFTADGQWVVHRELRAGAVAKPAGKSYKVEVKAGQRTIDSTGPGAGRPTMAGIYKLDGDTLTICFGEPGGERPTKFESPDGSRVMLMVLRRAKKD